MSQSIYKLRSNRIKEQLKVRKQIEAGIVPVNFNVKQIIKALFNTREKNVFELFGFLSAKHTHEGLTKDLGLLSCQKVTQAFAAYLADSMTASGSYPIDAFDYHGHGTGNTSEANTQTALVTEVDSRATGIPTNPSTYVYQSVGTITATGTHTIAEHGIFSAASTGTMLDRSLLSATIDVIADDTVEYTYQLTINAEA